MSRFVRRFVRWWVTGDLNVPAILLLSTAAGVAGVFLALSWIAPAPARVDPLAAYCRGFSDGTADVLLAQRAITPADYEEGAPIVDEVCMTADHAGLRGPLLP